MPMQSGFESGEAGVGRECAGRESVGVSDEEEGKERL